MRGLCGIYTSGWLPLSIQPFYRGATSSQPDFHKHHHQYNFDMIIRFLAAGILLHATATAQDNLSGTWTLQNKQHIAGPQYANSLPKQVSIHQQADSLVIETTSIGSGGKDVTNRQAVPMDGKPVTIDKTRKLVKSLKWMNNKKGFVLTTIYYRTEDPKAVDFTREEDWQLSQDGKQLNIDKKSIETRSEDWQVKGKYEKS